jgi:hypothetical protein
MLFSTGWHKRVFKYAYSEFEGTRKQMVLEYFDYVLEFVWKPRGKVRELKLSDFHPDI